MAYEVKVNGRSVGRPALKAGDVLSTDGSGAAKICLDARATIERRTGSDVSLRVMPSERVQLYVERSAKWVVCGGTQVNMKTPRATITSSSPRKTSAVERADDGTPPIIFRFKVNLADEATTATVVTGTLHLVDQAGHVQTIHGGATTNAVRRLWSSGKGLFRTKGQYSSATVRG